MDFLTELREKNIERSIEWCNGESPGPLFATVEFSGESGELADAVKKLYRVLHGMKSSMNEEEARQAVEEEAGDVLITLDILCREFDIDLREVTRRKFNKTSAKYGLGVLFGGSDANNDS